MFWWMMNGMGPRGPMHGHRGFDRGFGPRIRRPMGFRPGIGPWILFLLPALMFGGWIILAVIGGLIGAVIMILSSVFGGLASAAEAVFSGLTSTGGIAVGAVIGFWLYRILKRKNAEKAAAAETVEEETAETAPEYTPVNSWNNGNS